MSFFRYPGGKAKIRSFILEKIKSKIQIQYREPFFGGGSIGLNFLETNRVNSVWINDIDKGIASIWISVIKYPNELKEKVMSFVPSVDYFFKFKKELIDNMIEMDCKESVIDYGFKKLAIHQISYSGLGTKSGGPLGGKTQKSKYKIDCRWSPGYICKKIDKFHALFSMFDVKCDSIDFSELIEDERYESVIYLDPPYYIKGNDLYQEGFTEEDHKRLSRLLKNTKHQWILSYDDCDEVRDLYSWANIDEIEINYSITGAREKKELLIYS